MTDLLGAVQTAGLRIELSRDGTFRMLDGEAEVLRRCAAAVCADGRRLESTAGGLTDGAERQFRDVHGRGRLLEASGPAIDGLRLRLDVAVYDERPFALLRLGVANEGRAAVALASVSPLAGEALLPGGPAGWRFYRHGWQGTTPAVSLPALGRELGGLIGPPVHAPEPPPSEAGSYYSDDVGVLAHPSSGRSLALGFVTARDHLSQVRLVAGRRLEAICLADSVPLAPGATRWSERLLFDAAGDSNQQLARYGDALGAEMGARVPSPSPDGWCSWYRYFFNITEDIALANLRFAADHRDRLPFTYFQIDDGYQAGIGDWTTVNNTFPRGMAWLAREIRAAGFRPALWLAPLFAGAKSRLYAEHPDWVVRDDEGRPVVAMHNWEQDCYGLDGTNPAVRRWLVDLFREICEGWGYDYVKTDFLFGAAVKGVRADRTKTRAQAYRLALEAVREGVGPNRFILGCLALNAPTVGFCDSARIGPDVAPWWRWLSREQREAAADGAKPPPYHPDGVPQTLANILNTMTRSWMHGRLWANDPDCLLARATNTALTTDEVRTLATVIGLSGGAMFDSDDLTDLSPERQDLVSAMLPPLDRAATCRDLMERTFPSLFELECARPFASWRLAGLINLEDRARDVRLALPPGRWHAFEFWSRRYLGEYEGTFVARRLQPHTSRLLRLTPATGEPALVGSTFHIGQGVHELADGAYDRRSRTLRLSLRPVPLSRGTLYVWAPAGAGRPLVDGAKDAIIRRAAGAVWLVNLSVTEPRSLAVRFV